MQLFGVSTLVFLAFQGPVQAAITCTTTADCAWGETCVAGDSDMSIQACVPATVCGGSSMGNCPSDTDSGTLACLWRSYDDCSAGCALMDGKTGIYKCVSLSRCDSYYGGASCTDGCSVNGVRCNGQGSCNMMSTNGAGTPSFGCTCDNGYTGEKCEVTPGSTASNSSTTDEDDEDDEDSFWGALESADDSADGSDDSSTDGSEESSTDSSTDASEDSSTSASEDSSTDISDDSSADSSTDGSAVSSSDNAEDSSASGSSDESSSGSSSTAATELVSTDSQTGIRPGVLILVLVMAAFFLIGTVLLVAYSRRRKQQEEEDYESALASTHGIGAVGAVDAAGGHTGRTPRHDIATM